MSYTVLARRYRSSTFDDLVGQPQIAQTLSRAITTGRLAHAFLFCGTRGTGKTSTARILAKCLNCQAAEEPTTKPCGKCTSCQAIARGDDIDVIEIDAASNTGVDNVRDLIANSQFRPARSRFKIYIIDEAHMLSKSAFNALLKTLEEPPPHVKFMLATTEPEKIPATILSRCQRYDFRNISTREIADHLRKICKTEKVDADADALLAVAKAGAGSMRDALSLLDRLLSSVGAKLGPDDVQQLLGLPKPQLLFDLAGAIGRGDAQAALAGANGLISSGFSLDTLLASLSDHFRNLLILLTCGPDSDLVEAPGLAPDALLDQARQFTAPVLTQDIVILEELRRSTRSSIAARALVDATIVRLALADQFLPLSDLINRDPTRSPSTPGALAASKPQPTQKKTLGPERAERPSGERIEGASPERVELPTNRDEPIAPTHTELVEDFAPTDNPNPIIATVGPQIVSKLESPTPADKALQPVAIASDSPADLQSAWDSTLQQIPHATRSALALGQIAGIEDNRLVIRFPPTHETFVKRLNTKGATQEVSAQLSKLLARPIGIRLDIDRSASTAPTPTAAPLSPVTPPPPHPASPSPSLPLSPSPVPSPDSTAPQPNRITTEMRKTAENHPLVRALLQEFSGTITAIE